MSNASKGNWVWNIRPKEGGEPVKLTAGQVEVDENGVHFRAGPGHCGGLVASFPLGTLVWREEAPAVELVAGELARFDLPHRVEIGAINITVGGLFDAAALVESLREVLGKGCAVQ